MLLKQDELKEWLGFKRPGDLEKWLRDNRVPFFYGKGGSICTTDDAINSRLIGKQPEQLKRIEF